MKLLFLLTVKKDLEIIIKYSRVVDSRAITPTDCQCVYCAHSSHCSHHKINIYTFCHSFITSNNRTTRLQALSQAPDNSPTIRVGLKLSFISRCAFPLFHRRVREFPTNIFQQSVRDSHATWSVTSVMLADYKVTWRQRVVTLMTWQWREIVAQIDKQSWLTSDRQTVGWVFLFIHNE